MKNSMRRFISFILALVMVLGLVPGKLLMASAEETDTGTSTESGAQDKTVEYFAGKKVSILGDSISTYTKVSNNTSYNTTIGSNRLYYSYGGKYNVWQEDTWWQQAIDMLGMELCVNNSWSSSAVLTERAGTVGAYVDRCVQLHNDNTGEEPDVIWIFMGTNDHSYYKKTWGSADEVDYDTLYTLNADGTYTYIEPTTVYEAYAIMLHKMQVRYEGVEIYCLGLMARRDPVYSGSDVGQPTELNAGLKKVVEKMGCVYVDLESTISSDPEEFDIYIGDKRVHPNDLGMDVITQAVLGAMLEDENAACRISTDLTNVTSDSEENLLLKGDSFETTLTKAEGLKYLDVTVTMGGKDITAECYADGKITIASVTGDVQISAFAYGDAEMYRWEINEDGDAFVNVTTGDYTTNGLTLKSGTITDGLFDNILYQFEKEITLEHDKQWIIEWKSSGDWNGMLLSSSTGNSNGMSFLFRKASKDLLALGTYDSTQSVKYQNYGIDTTSFFDNVAEHVYRLENRVNSDGTNMVYLVVDNMEIGAMNNFYQSTTDMGTTVDWLNGQDLTFNYMGKSAGSHYLTDITLSYLEIKKDASGEHHHAYKLTSEVGGTCSSTGYYVYSCHCGDYYTESNGQQGTDHTYETWELIDGLLYRECKYCGEVETKTLSGYRWEMNEAGDAFVSIADEHNTENALELLNGSVSNGSFSQVQYQMAAPITLSHEQEWVIEWRSTGDWSGVLLSTTKTRTADMNILFRRSDLGLGVGTYIGTSFYNYGVHNSQVTSYMTGTHTFRLENRVTTAEDGTVSNMIYLVIDDYEIGDMTRYFSGATDKGTTSDWVNGKDLTFQYFGMGTSHYVKNFKPEYMQIWLNGAEHQHAYVATDVIDANCSSTGQITYTCNCGETKTEHGDELGDHVYGEWQTVDGELRRYCKFCGGYESDKLKGYRWEYNSETNELVSVITDGNTQNKLTLVTGSITDGLFTNVIYKLGSSIELSHEDAWVIEWESSGDWNGMLLSSSTGNADGMNFLFRKDSTDLLALGTYVADASTKYYNYGIDTTSYFDVEQTHVFRLENRINEDGTNMVYLVVDNIEIGAMNNFYLATTSQKTTSDWLNGQDLTFSYIGKSAGSHHLNNIVLSYLQIWMDRSDVHMHAYTEISSDEGSCVQEGTKTYVCYCGETYTASTGVYGKHSYETWTVVGEERQSTCELCGEVLSVKLGTHYDESVSDGYYTVISQKDYVLCDGVTESEIIINNSSGTRRQVMHVVEVDTQNPNVEILAGYYGIDKDLTNSDNWSVVPVETTMDYYRDVLGYNVVAGMNTALTYSSSAPCSFLVYNGKVLATPGSIYNDNCDTYLAVTKNEDGTVSCELRSMSEDLHGDEWQAFSCNFGFTVKDGKVTASSISRSSGSDRSMIGIKADGTLVIVEVEGRNSPYSYGLSSTELGEAMLALGCVWAVNGDGGGSSQIVTKREGESDYVLRSICSDGSPRATIQSIIIASKAASSGMFDHVSMLAESEYITPGGSVNVEVKGVDGSGMPADMPEGITYEATGGSYADGVFTSDGTLGEQTVTAYYNGEKVGSISVNVVIPTSISFDNAAMAVPYGKSVEIAISAYYGTFEVAVSGADIEFTLSAAIGSIDGLLFTAPSEENAGEANTAELTATLVHNRELTAVIPVYVGKGSEVLYDFEDQNLHGWYRSTASAYNAIRVGGETYLVDSNSGHVYSGDYAMAVELDYSNSLEPGFMLGTLVPGEWIVLENALTIGMWVYIPDEADGLRIDISAPVYYSKEFAMITSYLTPAAGVADGGETTIAEVGFVSAFDESGWHYITVDLSSAEFTGLPTLKFYVSLKDGVNGYVYGEQTNVNGKFVLYVDDITVDYSQAVDDRESPIFGDMTYSVDGMDEPETLDGNTVDINTVSFETTVADNTVKNNYSGVDASSAQVYIDGVDYTEKLTVSGLTDLTLSLNNVTLSDGMHTVKFIICDKMGNRSAIVRTIIVNSADDANVKVVAHDPNANRILTGSLYYIDIVANDPETISSVTVTLDLNNISVWQLDHMNVAKGFEATYTLVEDENIATVTITAVGTTTLSGEDQVLVSIPIRTWELPVVEPIYGHNGEVYMYDDYKATNSILPMDLNVEIDAGYVVYKDGSTDSFTSPKILVMTELSGNGYTDSGSASLIYIGGEDWYADWNGGHDHRPETKEYYDENSTNHVDAIALEDKEAGCTEDGYTGRTYCEVCQSVVDWGTAVPATGHSYEFIDDVLKCECGELFNGLYTDGKTYVDGVVSSVNGWIGESYFKDGTMLTGIQKVPAPDDAATEYYYDFGEDGICKNQMKYTGMFRDGDVNRYSYIGSLASGWQTVDGSWYYFSPKTLANVSGKYTVDGIEFEFDENGKIVTGAWVEYSQGRRYYYGPSYYDDRWNEIDGEWYYFKNGFCITGVNFVEAPGMHKMLNRWYDFGEYGVAVPFGTGFYTLEDGRTIYVEDGYAAAGLYKVGDDYYCCRTDGELICGMVYYAWATNCDLPCDNYEFGADGKMLQGLVEKEDGLYYYVNGKVAKAGLTKIGEDYYFIRSSGKCATGSYYAYATNCDLPCGSYEFGADGKMLNPPVTESDVSMTYEEYIKLSAEEQAAFRETFSSVDEFFAWYNEEKAAYDEQNSEIEVGDGSVDLGDIMDNNSGT